MALLKADEDAHKARDDLVAVNRGWKRDAAWLWKIIDQAMDAMQQLGLHPLERDSTPMTTSLTTMPGSSPTYWAAWSHRDDGEHRGGGGQAGGRGNRQHHAIAAAPPRFCFPTAVVSEKITPEESKAMAKAAVAHYVAKVVNLMVPFD
jgi:hypothetical protein